MSRSTNGTRKLNGKFHTLYEASLMHTEAKNIAKELRKSGKYESVRVVPMNAFFYSVYVFG